MHEQETLEIIYGINPVKEALRAGMPMERAYTCKAQGAVLPLIGQLKALNVPIDVYKRQWRALRPYHKRGMGPVCAGICRHGLGQSQLFRGGRARFCRG